MNNDEPIDAIPCPNCNGSERSFYARENGYDLFKCIKCGLLYVVNPPSHDNISKAHEQGLHEGEEKIEVTGYYSDASEKNQKSRLEDIYSDSPPCGKWLDIGSGHGELMIALGQLYGNDLTIVGSEPNKKKQLSAKNKGLDVSFIQLEEHDARYDFISLMNVFSHLPSPKEFFVSIHRLLESNGKLLIQTGDTANFEAKDHYRPFFLPDHLMFANEAIVSQMLECSGFKIISVNKYPYRVIDLKFFLKELAKLFLPNHKSQLFEIAKNSKWTKTDMYILAQKI